MELLYSARWKDIESAMIKGVPIAAIIADSKLTIYMTDKNNPWINIALKIWQETVKLLYVF